MFQPLNNLSFVNCNTLVLRYFYLQIYMIGPLQLSYQCDLFFTKLWAITEQMPEMEKACRKYQNGHV